MHEIRKAKPLVQKAVKASKERACTFPERIWDWLKKTIEEIMTQ